ncbi:Maf family protein [Agilicoccus flavus]|uniref:Maf family protein n=1 Tax=Agilicoccus flavus TaxID=2775968 RepID=UPI001CF652D3|nr:Maf family protein [Agilicoccus flavus]
MTDPTSTPPAEPAGSDATLLLASASPARLATLRAAGVSPRVLVSGVDEDVALADARARYGELAPADAALVLARAKAEAVAAAVEASEDDDDVIVLGCDSVLEIDGAMYGKPGDAATARDRWATMRGGSGDLHTGHWLVDLRADGTGGTLGQTATTTVHFADLDDDEIDAYVATGEPLAVAGAFTLDGLGGPFVERIEGDPHNVVGVSLPLLRQLLLEIDVPWASLWPRGR